jgi:hypothetical protein
MYAPSSAPLSHPAARDLVHSRGRPPPASCPSRAPSTCSGGADNTTSTAGDRHEVPCRAAALRGPREANDSRNHVFPQSGRPDSNHGPLDRSGHWVCREVARSGVTKPIPRRRPACPMRCGSRTSWHGFGTGVLLAAVLVYAVVDTRSNLIIRSAIPSRRSSGARTSSAFLRRFAVTIPTSPRCAQAPTPPRRRPRRRLAAPDRLTQTCLMA